MAQTLIELIATELAAETAEPRKATLPVNRAGRLPDPPCADDDSSAGLEHEKKN
jgi:hypothetical protein